MTGVSPHGDNALEFAFMVEAGMPPMKAIQSATRTAAELLALRARDLDDRGGEANARLAEKKTSLEAAIAKQRSLEASLVRAGINPVRQAGSGDSC